MRFLRRADFRRERAAKTLACRLRYAVPVTLNRWWFGWLVALVPALSACSSPADEVNGAPTLTFVVENQSGLDLGAEVGWVKIDGDFPGRELWNWDPDGGHADLCDPKIRDYGGLPPPVPNLPAGERFVFRWKENAFAAPTTTPGILDDDVCQNIERVPTGRHAFTFCAYPTSIECVVPGEVASSPQQVCLTVSVELTDDDLTQNVVFRPETVPTELCLMGTEQQK